MPIFEYRCRRCGEEFDKLVLGPVRVECPRCASRKVVKRPSVFGMSGVQRPTSSGCAGCKTSSCGACKG